MADYEEPNAPQGLNAGRLAAAAMALGAALLAVVTTVWALVRFWEISQSKQPTAGDVLRGLRLAVQSEPWLFLRHDRHFAAR